MLDKFKVLRNAETYVVNRQFGRAISEYRSLLETKGEDPALLNTLGDLLLKNKEQAEALSYFRRVAQIFIESGFTNKAIAVCKKIHKLDPSDRETVGQLADLYTKRGFQSQAAKYYRQLVAESRDAGRFQEAADWQKNILAVFPGEPGPFAEMAELNLELEEANGALGNFVTASWLSFKKGAYQESVEYADQALSVDELSEAASRLKEVASSVLADGDSVLSDPAFQLDDELFASIVPFKADESETGAEEPAKESPEELVTAPRTTESSDGTGELAAKPEDDWSKSQEAVDDYSAVGEFDGDAAKEESASEAEGSDEFLTAVEAESEPEAETVHELSEDIIDNDLHDVEELLKDVARVEADSEQQPEDFGMVEGARLGELDIKVGGTVDTFERYGEVLGSDEFGETPTEPEIPESSEKLTGAQEEVSTGIDAADEEVNEHSDEGQLDSEAVEAAAAENDAAQGTPEYDRIEGLVGTDEHLQEDTSAGAVEEASPEQALASELDSGEGFEDEQSVLGVIEIPEDVETPEEPLDALVEDDELAATSLPKENDEIFEVSAEESADEVIKRLEEVPFESEGADLGVESAVSEPREDETVLEIADDFSVEDLSAVSVEDLFEEAVSAEESFDSTEESLEQTLDLDEIEEFGSKESDTAVTFQGFESFENESAVEEETVEHQTMDGSSEETVLDQEFLRKLYDDEFQSNREDLEEPKLETIEQEAAEQETVEAS
ncbi:MAG TPA: hypothetical protein VMY18_04645, partial [Acidobacteriota bacterium]|nr:hypothetical protein [Acidobacteriota bacterium]